MKGVTIFFTKGLIRYEVWFKHSKGVKLGVKFQYLKSTNNYFYFFCMFNWKVLDIQHYYLLDLFGYGPTSGLFHYELDHETWLCQTHLDDFLVELSAILDHIRPYHIISYLNLLDLFELIWINLDIFGPVHVNG